ncbi:hypothetical protein KW796_02495 [Candidatus Parcubacteria bacterium]|nr:hypothetical protein [Candidatus Parcubacteria bacterium]
MRFRILLALSLSIVLIFGATWTRRSTLSQPVLVSVESPASISGSTPDSADLSYDESISRAKNDPLSTTDLVSRQLLLDYINLSSTGQATPDNLDSLASQYVEKISALSQTPKISLMDLNTVADSKASLTAYDKSVTAIETEKIETVNRAYVKIADSADIYSLTEAIASAYKKASEKLKSIPVPASVAQKHAELINNYIATSAGMESITDTNGDSIAAFAGIAAINDAVGKEDQILNEIAAILMKNGI